MNRLDVVDTGRRRRWSDGEKERIVLESMAGPRQISATARRHGIARSQLLAWRRALLVEPIATPSGFIPMLVTPETDQREDARTMGAGAPPASAVSALTPGRIEIVLRSGRRMIVEGAADMDAVLKLARGLEALR
ncbi:MULTISPECIES: transposase [Alphaproteobacteria]|uniref:IS66-like element accessory protein TnpA n=1 Tax=Alphaproteobacteria TaxID=28211 RepID=UPI0025BB5250|nr:MULTISPECIES: transposase [Alphaproteobacteria]MBQ1562135.1 transposase [Caulobacter sp.]